MKKTVAVFACMIAMAVLLACGGDKGATGEPAGSAAGAVAKNESAAPAGKAYDCKYFTMTVAEGWDAGPLTFGMVNVLPRGQVSPGLYFKFEGEGNAMGTAESSIQATISNYRGSPMEDVTIAGVGFKATTYTYSGSPQAMHVAYRSGTKVTITIEGVNARDNAAIKAMLGTVAFK